eukprot:2952363-Pyramimonas_sp.AAC.1
MPEGPQWCPNARRPNQKHNFRSLLLAAAVPPLHGAHRVGVHGRIVRPRRTRGHIPRRRPGHGAHHHSPGGGHSVRRGHHSVAGLGQIKEVHRRGTAHHAALHLHLHLRGAHAGRGRSR